MKKRNKMEDKKPKVEIIVKVDSISELVEQPEVVMDRIESRYVQLRKYPEFREPNTELTVVISGRESDTSAQEILASFREEFSPYFMNKHERACLDVAQQLHAVSKALFSAKRVYINDHIEHCFDETASSSPKKLKSSIKELKDITRYLG